MSSYPPTPGSGWTRRAFVGAVATGVGAAALSGRAAAAPRAAAAKVDRAVGVARLGSTVHTLGRTGEGWLLVAANGSARPVSGLDGADVADLATAEGGLVAVGSVPEGDRQVPTVWESVDGLAWRVAARLSGLDGHLSAVAVHGGAALAVGAHLTLERAPRQRLVLRGGAAGWDTVAVTGLEHTDRIAATAVAGGRTGWLLATVDSTGSLVATSADGAAWTPSAVEPRLVDAAVRALADTAGGVRWIANGMGGMATVGGVLGGARYPVAVPAGAQALGVVAGRSYWLADGRIVTATV